MKNGLEVFDFKEEDDLPDLASKFKNPSIDDSALLKYQFLQNAAQGSDVLKKEVHSLPCLDVDEMESDHNHENSSAGDPDPSETVKENMSTKEGDPDLVKVAQLNSSGPLPDQSSEMDTFGSFVLEVRCNEDPTPVSPEKTRLDYVAPDIPSNADNGDKLERKSDADESSNESSQTSPPCQDGGSGVMLSGDLSTDWFGHVEIDGVSILVDYIVHRRHSYHARFWVTFTSNTIKVNDFTAHETQETFNLERGIDAITCIESQHLHRFDTVLVKLMLSTEVVQHDNADGFSGFEELEFSVCEPNWISRWQQITSLNAKYSTIWRNINEVDVRACGRDHQQKPYFPNFDEAFEEVVYPKGDSDAVSITKRDVDLLQPETFVNDNIIDFYINYLKNQIPPAEKPKFHFFNSFFFRKLADMDKDPSSALDGRAAFLRVHKWTRKVDIFGKDFIFIPVNFNLHWSLLVICYPGEVADLKEEHLEKAKSVRVPCILHMDSIRGTHSGLKNLVQSYLWEEWKVRHKETAEDLSSKFMNLRFVPLELPQQENSYDCGLFLLHYLEQFLAEVPVDFSPFQMNKFSTFLSMDWFTPAEASLKRTLIQRLISDILENHSSADTPSNCSGEPLSNFQERCGRETGVEFVSRGCISSQACDGNLSGAEAGQGIEMTLLQASSGRNSQCVNDPGLVLREFFEPGVSAAGSLSCSAFDQTPSYYGLNCTMPQIEESAEAGEQFAYFTPGESVFPQINGLTPEARSVPCSLRPFEADASWNPGLSIQRQDKDSPAESSHSDDSDVGIIEDYRMEGDTVPFQEGKDGQQKDSLTETIGCLTDTLVSTSSQIVGTSAIENACGPNDVHDALENGGLASAQENPSTPSNKESNLEVNGFYQDLKMQVNDANVIETANDAVAESEQPNAKRLKLSTPLEAEGSFTQSLSEDLRL